MCRGSIPSVLGPQMVYSLPLREIIGTGALTSCHARIGGLSRGGTRLQVHRHLEGNTTRRRMRAS